MSCAGGHFTDGDDCLAAENFVLNAVQAAIGFGKLLGKISGFFTNLRGPQGKRPSLRQAVQFLDLRAQAFGFTGACAPNDAADALVVGIERNPESRFTTQPWGECADK